MEYGSTGNNHLQQSQVPNFHPQFGHYFHQFLGTQNPNPFHSLPHPQFASCYYYPPTAADSSSSSSHPEYPAANLRNLAALQQRGVDSNANVGAVSVFNVCFSMSQRLMIIIVRWDVLYFFDTMEYIGLT